MTQSTAACSLSASSASCIVHNAFDNQRVSVNKRLLLVYQSAAGHRSRRSASPIAVEASRLLRTVRHRDDASSDVSSDEDDDDYDRAGQSTPSDGHVRKRTLTRSYICEIKSSRLSAQLLTTRVLKECSLKIRRYNTHCRI